MKATKRSMMGAFLTLSMLVGLLALGVTPASASAASQASVDVKNVLAGLPGQQYRITIKNNELVGNSNPGPLGSPAGASINYVIVEAPDGFTVTSASGPNADWADPFFFDSRRVQFAIAAGRPALAPQAPATFTITANAPVTPRDMVKNWKAWTSSNGGEGNTLSASTAPGLDTTVRILTSEFPGLTQPAGITDLSVTQGQGTDTRDQTATRQPKGVCTVTNHGSAIVSTKATLTGDQVNSGGESAAQDLTPGANDVPFDFNLSFGNPGTKGTTCNAKAYDAAGNVIAQTINGFNETKNIVIEPRVTFTVNNFSPKVVVPGDTVALQVDVTAQGVPAALLASPATNIEFDTPAGKFGPAALTSSGDFPRGAAGARRVVLSFASTLIPGTAFDDENTPTDERTRGKFDIRADYVGEDDNNTTISFLDQVVGQITLDPDIPVLDLNLPDGPGFPASWTAPRGQNDWNKVSEAVKNGSAVSFTGTIKDTDPQSGLLVNCGGCVITASLIRQFGADGNEVAPIPLNCTNSGGNISCSYNGGYDAAAVKFDWTVTAHDAIPDHTTTTDSGEMAIDNVIPQIGGATTLRTTPTATDPIGRNRNSLLVTIPECIAGTSNALDGTWTVDLGDESPNQVTAVGAPTCTALGADSFESTIELTLLNDFPDDLPEGVGTLTYRPALASDNYDDRVDFDLCGQNTPKRCDASLLDGIAPLVPQIVNITPGSSDEGKFWTNTTGPTVTVSGSRGKGEKALDAGYLVEIFEETNGTDGLQRTGGNPDSSLAPSERVIEADCTGDDESGGTCTVSVSTSGLTLDEDEKTVYAVSLDTAQQPNLSPSALAALVLDQTVPVVSQVTPTVGKVTVSFSEKIAFGRNFGSDWQMRSQDGEGFVPNTVTGGGTTTRDLNTTDPGYSAATLASVRYFFHGSAGQRYADRATNELGDFTVLVEQI